MTCNQTRKTRITANSLPYSRADCRVTYENVANKYKYIYIYAICLYNA